MSSSPVWPDIPRTTGPAGGSAGAPAAGQEPARRAMPHVVAWNLTRRCNLECAHCYISAGSWQQAEGELSTDEVRRIAGEILEINPNPLFILSGGEPLLREDLEDIAEFSRDRGATVVVGTNGTRLTRERIGSLKAAGVTGMAVSVDSLRPEYHDRFRHGDGALAETLAAVDRCREQEMDFIVQTSLTRGNRPEITSLAAWAADRGAVSFNLYFLVSTGRGEGMQGLSPAENDDVLRELVALEREHRGRMLVRSKCQPQLMRHVHLSAPDSPLAAYETRCPCGVQYCRITPEGKLTPCPYTPAVAGDLREQSFSDVWFGSPVLQALRSGQLGGKCGRCEYKKVCGGCRARAHADCGDLMGPDESCSYEPTGALPLVEPTAQVTFGAAVQPSLAWTEEARARMDRVPSFVRGVVMGRVEAFARERGAAVVTPELLDEVRRSMPVDFGKRLPFFARPKDE